jgi:2-keto-4-pentenoate hydratase/2-oxohepta-3-ene-1,7-dioic acid hydratase in catechol pathway
MKIVTFTVAGEQLVGLVDGDVVVEAGADPINVKRGERAWPLADVQLLAPIPRPGKVICVGLNYRDHAEESNMAIPTSPVLFTKFANAVVADGAPIVLPAGSTQVDYEAELAVVIGRTAQAVSEGDAFDYVLGYTCANDVSARDFQFADGQWFRGKGQDTFCPLGPWIVTTDELTDPQSLNIRCVVNGEALQDSSTKEMIFGVAELVSFISHGITLEPGDIILTGTPVGVGFARKPPVFLTDGDTVTIEIEGIGSLTNPVVAAQSALHG